MRDVSDSQTTEDLSTQYMEPAERCRAPLLFLEYARVVHQGALGA